MLLNLARLKMYEVVNFSEIIRQHDRCTIMSSSIIAEAILMISVVVAASALTYAFYSSISSMEASYKSINDSINEELRTAITIVFVTNTSSTIVKAWIKNIGSSRIPAQLIELSDIFFGNKDHCVRIPRYSSDYNYGWTYRFCNSNDDVWDPCETIEITVYLNETLTTGDYYLIFITYNGVKAEAVFSIG